MTLRFALTVAIAALLGLAGCSALVDPDKGKLGGDAGTGLDGGDTDGGDTDGGGTDGGDGCPGGCDDGVACTVDSCIEGSCVNEPNGEACGPDERCNRARGCVPVRCRNDADCDDGLYCNGKETCDRTAEGADPMTGCVPGAPVECDDGVSCTMDSCDEDADSCVAEPDDEACRDGVSCTVDSCDPSSSDADSGCVHEPDDSLCDDGFCFTGGSCDPGSGCSGGDERDCRDGDVCTMDHCDSDAEMCVNEPRDDDGDGFAVDHIDATDCGGSDCDDGNAAVNPDATEMCNGIDDDCDGETDEGCVEPPDTCSTAQEIELTGGSGSVTGSFAMLGSEYRSQCSDGFTRDAVYYVDITSLSDVTIDTIGSDVDTSVAVAFDCGSFGLACDNDMVPGSDDDARVWAHRIRPRIGDTSVRLYILVENESGVDSGGYTVNVEVESASTDACSSPTLDVTGGGTVVGFIGSAVAVGNETGTCMSDFDTSPEGVVTLLGPSSGELELQAFSADFVPDMYVRESPCGSSDSEVDCETGTSDGGSGGFAVMTTSVTDGDRYWVFVDGAGAGDAYVLFYNP